MGHEEFDADVTVIGRNADKNERKHERFYLIEEELWNIKINQHTLYPSAIRDLNSGGMLILVDREQASLRGKIIPLTLKVEGKVLIRGEAVVRWSKIHPEDRTKMYMGLQFEDPHFQIAKNWQEFGVKRFISKQKPEPEAEIEIIEPRSWARNIR